MNIHDRLEDQSVELQYLRPAFQQALTILDRLYAAYMPPNNQPTSIDQILDLIDGDVAEFVQQHHPDWMSDATEGYRDG